MSRSLNLHDVISHPEFGDEGWERRKNHSETKKRFCDIIEKIIGIHPETHDKYELHKIVVQFLN